MKEHTRRVRFAYGGLEGEGKKMQKPTRPTYTRSNSVLHGAWWMHYMVKPGVQWNIW
jgi:hypothetical protein